MLLAQMPISSHRQRTSIGVPEPARNGRYINTRLDAKGRKEVSQVVVSHPVTTDFFRGARESLLRLVNAKDRVFMFWLPFGVQPFEKLAQRRNHWDCPVAGRRLLPRNRNHALLEIHVSPKQERGLANSGATVDQTLDKIATIAALPRASSTNGRHELSKLSPCWEFKFLSPDAGFLQISGGVAINRAFLQADLE